MNKKEILSKITTLPEDLTMEDFEETIDLINSIEEIIDNLDESKLIPIEDIKKEFCTCKSNFQPMQETI